MIAWLVILAALLAVPPLTDTQERVLDSTRDGDAVLERPGLHALVENALLWEAGDEAGSRVPDYDGLLASPVSGRGDLFLLEGRLAGRARRIALSDTGRWVDALTEWVLVVREDPEEVAVVYFADPDGQLVAPPTGAEVRVTARFYKVWADTDSAGNPTRYLTFVARWPSVAGGPAAGQPTTLLPMLLLVMVLGVVYLLVRRMGRTPRDMARHSPPGVGQGMLSGPGGPEDPAEALERMAGRRDDT